ncbi:MAG: RNA-binding protein [Ilumatobacter sp.]|nr:RNA-binding protein [Ilumatobacter sp.]
MIWIVDGNNVYGSRPDGWWNDRSKAATRLAQRVAEWCRTHDDDVILVFDAPVADETLEIAGGNLRIVESSRRGRDAADHEIVAIAAGLDPDGLAVVTSDRGLRDRLDDGASVLGTGRFRDLIGY